MAIANHVLLRRITLTASASSVTFDSIPQTGYTDLKIVASGRNTGTSTGNEYTLSFNGSTTGFTTRNIYGGGSGSGGSYTGANTAAFANNSAQTANTFDNWELYVPNYTSGNYKSYSIDGVMENNVASTGAYVGLLAGLWSNVAAISSITITPPTGNLIEGSLFSLYGVADFNTTPNLSPKADGGNIVKTDGTYWYHAFLSSGVFRPQLNLTADVLVVAGGGGGGGGNGGGGGGAGGYVALNSQSLASATNYTCTIGAGGTGGGLNDVGTNGVNSQFGALTAAIGGGGGANGGNTANGGNGGSGGGSTRAGTPGTFTSGQGYAGGTSLNASGGYYSTGGGGGAGAAGGNGTANAGGNGAGGAGSNAHSTWASATSTGVSGYFAGGGGGGGTNGSNGPTVGASGGSGGGGGGGSINGPQGGAGNVNSGSGGGGGSGTTSYYIGGTGGSGIVIIRYPV